MGNSVMLNGVEYAGEQIAYKDSTYELVSKVAYLIGVPLRIFQNEHEPPKIEIYDRLEQDKNARIVPFPVSWTVKMKKKQKETQDILSYHSQAAGCSDKARAKASGGRQPIEECGRTGL